MDTGTLIAVVLLAAVVLFTVLSVDVIPSPSREYARQAPEEHH